MRTKNKFPIVVDHLNLRKKEIKPVSKKEEDWLLDSSPVIVMGRGGSGTRIPSYFLREDLGYFFGEKINKSEDSIDWKETCLEIVKEYGHQIDLPEYPDNVREMVLETGRNVLQEKKYPDKWGWKIPHTLLFFPIIANIFPKSKFIHIIRHPIPSSIGYRRESDKTSRIKEQGKDIVPASYAYFHKRSLAAEKLENLYSDSEKTQMVLNAYGWNHQVGRAIEYGRKNLKDRYLEIKYEDVCEDPQKELERICEFLQIEKIPKTKLQIDPSLSPSNLKDLKDYKVNEKVLKRAERIKKAFDKKKEAGPIVEKICKETAEKIGYKL